MRASDPCTDVVGINPSSGNRVDSVSIEIRHCWGQALVAQGVFDQSVEIICVLELGPVAAFAEDVKLRALDAPEESERAVEWRHEVVGTPYD